MLGEKSKPFGTQDTPKEIDFGILEELNPDNKKPEGRPEKSAVEPGSKYLSPEENEKTPSLSELLHQADDIIPKEKSKEWESFIERNTVGYTYDKGEHIHRFSPETCKSIVDILGKLQNSKESLSDILEEIQNSENEDSAVLIDAAFRFADKGPALKLLSQIDTYLPDKLENPSQLTPDSGLTVNIATQIRINSSQRFFKSLEDDVANSSDPKTRLKNLRKTITESPDSTIKPEDLDSIVPPKTLLKNLKESVDNSPDPKTSLNKLGESMLDSLDYDDFLKKLRQFAADLPNSEILLRSLREAKKNTPNDSMALYKNLRKAAKGSPEFASFEKELNNIVLNSLDSKRLLKSIRESSDLKIPSKDLENAIANSLNPDPKALLADLKKISANSSKLKERRNNLGESIAKIPELYKKSKGLIPDESLKAWKEALCLNATKENAKADIEKTLKIMQALENGTDVMSLYGYEKEGYGLEDEAVRDYMLRFSKFGPAYYKATLPSKELTDEEKKYCVNPKQATENRRKEVERQEALIASELNRRQESGIESLELPEKSEEERIHDINKHKVIGTLYTRKPNYKKVIEKLDQLERRESLRKKASKATLEESERQELEELENVEELKMLDYHEICQAAYSVERTGKILTFIRNAEVFMPMDETRKPSFTEGWRRKQLPSILATRALSDEGLPVMRLIDDTLKDKNAKGNDRLWERFDDYENAINSTTELWLKAKILVKPEYLEQFRELLCEDALSQSQGLKTKHIIGLMTALENGTNILEKDENGEFIYAIEDNEVLDIILHFSKHGLDFYSKYIKSMPKTSPDKFERQRIEKLFKTRKEKLALELALVKSKSDSYDEVLESDILKKARLYVDKLYNEELESAA